MTDFKDSKTFQNLTNAFAGESQARNRYTFFASEAKKAGYMEIQKIFLETADNEREHAKIFYKHMVENLGEDVPNTITVTGTYPIELGDNEANLLSAALGEEEEVVMYTEMAEEAEEEGYKAVARSYRAIAAVETHHAQRYRKLLDNVKNDKVFEKDESVQWICSNCGYIHTGKKAPELCPACLHPKSYFEVLCEAY